MAKLSKRSLTNLGQCHPKLQELAKEAIKEFDFVVICGHRGEKAQNEAYATGKSRLKFPKSKHNKKPSLAMDCVPYPIDWGNISAFKKMCTTFEKVAKALNIKIRLGRDFSFKDYPHIELL